jgi:hypothetical protein
MSTSIFIFLLTTLPLAIYKITSPRQANISSAIFTVITVWTGLNWFQTLNYAVNISLLRKYYFSFFFVDKLLQSLSYFKIISQRIPTTNEIFMW